jgi:hypothetical protein
MVTVAATFRTAERARAAVEALRARLPGLQHLSLLAPGTSSGSVEKRVPTEEGEAPGMGAAVGGVVGAALGLATASVILPGIGPIVVAGMLAAGLAGAAGGSVVGDQLEDNLTRGIPRDELETYKKSLARGCTVVIVGLETDEEAATTRDVLSKAGAEVDPARDWNTAAGQHAAR